MPTILIAKYVQNNIRFLAFNEPSMAAASNAIVAEAYIH
jgi:hypothetical protein